MKKMFYFVLLFIFAADLYSFEVDFFPQKRARNPQEIRVRFSKNVAPLGDPSYNYNPIHSISCIDTKTDGVWEEPSLFVMRFEKPLPSGLKCRVELRDDIKSTDGELYKGEKIFQFDTDVVTVNNIIPNTYQRIRNEEIFLFSFNGEVDIEKNISKIYFLRRHTADSIGAILLSNADKEKLIEAIYPYLKASSSKYFAIKPKVAFADGEDITVVFDNIESRANLSSGFAQRFTYEVMDGFKIEISCERESAKKGCIPISGVTVNFSEPIEAKYVEGFYLIDENNKKILSQKPKEYYEVVTSISFAPPFFPEHRYKLYVPEDIVDIYGRKAINIKKFPLEFNTDRMPPLLKFAADFGILEMINGEAILPLTVRGLDKDIKIRATAYNDVETEMKKVVKEKPLLARMWERLKSLFVRTKKDDELLKDERRYIVPEVKVRSHNLSETTERRLFRLINYVDYDNYEESFFQKYGLDYEENSIQDIASFKEPTVVGIPFKRYGLYLLEIESGVFADYLIQEKKGKWSEKAYLHSIVLVTDMAVTFKRGRDSSLVFVTRLSDGHPVEGADVKVFDCKGKEYFAGKTDKDGILYIDKRLPANHELPECIPTGYIGYRSNLKHMQSEFIVTARKGPDFSFVSSTWESGLESYRYNIYKRWFISDYAVHSVLSRNLLRAGETLHIVGFFRKKIQRDFIFANKEEMPRRIKIEHAGTGKVWEYNIDWDGTASTLVKWDVPKDANTGHYRITYFDCPFDTEDSKCDFDGGMFLVEEFKVPLIKGELIVKDSDSKKVIVEGIFNYLMGAPANDLEVTLRYRFLDSFYYSDRRYNGYEFSSGKVKPEVQRQRLSSYNEDEYSEEQEVYRTYINLPEKIHVKTDEYGRFKAEIPIKKEYDRPFVLNIEAGYTDPNGYFNTFTTSKTIYNSPFIIGLFAKPDRDKKEIRSKVVLLDREKKAVKGENVVVNIYQKVNYAHRKKVIGGYYAYEYATEIKALGEMCRGVTDSKGMFECKKVIEKGGNYLIEAISGDEKRGFAATNKMTYMFHYEDDSWFDYSSDSDRIDILPDKNEYKVGEEIKLRVVAPFERCTALVTVEKSGILSYFVKEFSSKSPFIGLTAEQDFAPNVVISVVLVRGRIGSPPPTFFVDLAKPSIKMGLTEVNIDKEKYRLNMDITTEKKKYLVREKVYGKVKVHNASKESNVMLIVVDEGLLNLMENPTYDILNGMVKKALYDVSTSSGMIQVVGRRHFGKKALPSGGGGGRIVTRELFDTLIYFNPVIQVKKGVADFQFTLNDSITSFRIIAIATSGSNKFGMAYKNIESSRELFINSSLPYFAREGDRYEAEFVIKNVMEREYNLDIVGDVTFYNNGKELKREKLNNMGVKVNKSGNKKITFPISVIENADEARFHIELLEGKRVVDSINVSQKIVEAVPMRVVQSSFVRFKKLFKTNDIDVEERNIKRRINLSFMSNLSGVGEVLKKYRGYTLACLEQKISYAIVANDSEYFSKIMNEINLYVDDNGLFKYYPSSKEGSPFLTAYILEITRLNNFEIPWNIKAGAVGALRDFIMGKISSKHSYLSGTRNIERIYALSAISPDISNNADLLGALNPNISELPLSTIVDIANISHNRKDVRDAILSSFTEKGGAYFIKTDNKNNFWWLMRSEDEAFARSLIYFITNKADDTIIGKMVKGLLNRFERGYLYNTTANAYAAVALRLFEKKYKSSIAGSLLDIRYKCNQYKFNVGSDFLEKTFLFTINRDNLVLGGDILSDCLQQDTNNEISFEDKSNNYWVRMLFEEESKVDKPVFKGFVITKEILDEAGKKKSEFRQGDLMKVRLIIESDAYYNNMVVIDPLITGSQVAGRISKQDSKYDGYFWDYTYSDVRDGFIRTYYEYLFSKKVVYEYLVRLNTRGYYNLPPTRVELMYMPDIYGELPNSAIEVK